MYLLVSLTLTEYYVRVTNLTRVTEYSLSALVGQPDTYSILSGGSVGLPGHLPNIDLMYSDQPDSPLNIVWWFGGISHTLTEY